MKELLTLVAVFALVLLTQLVLVLWVGALLQVAGVLFGPVFDAWMEDN